MSKRWLMIGVVAAAVLGAGLGSLGQGPSAKDRSSPVDDKEQPSASASSEERSLAADPFAAPAAQQNPADEPPRKPFWTGRQPAEKSPRAAQRPEVVALRAGEKAILAALEEPTDLSFTDAPLQDVMDSIQATHRIHVILDKKALDQVGITSDTPITKTFSGITLRSALNLLLHDLDLTWIIRDEVLMITTPEEAQNQLLTRVYEVADLVTCRDDHGELWDDHDVLVDLITCAIAPDSWDDVGGPGSIMGDTFAGAKVLVVRQETQIHEQIAQLLADIRAVAAQHKDQSEPPLRKRRPRAGMMGGGMGGKAGRESSSDAKSKGDRGAGFGGF